MVKNQRRKKKKEAWECFVCGAENDEEDELCPDCGSHRGEPCYDVEDDLGV